MDVCMFGMVILSKDSFELQFFAEKNIQVFTKQELFSHISQFVFRGMSSVFSLKFSQGIKPVTKNVTFQ